MFEKIKEHFLKSFTAIVTSMAILISSTVCAQTTGLDESENFSNYSKSIITRIKTKHANNPELCNSEISALVETLLYTSSSNNQSTNIDKEIKKYKDRAPEIFEIEDDVIKEADPEVLLRTLIQLNKLFDKYKNFTQKLIKTIKSKKYSQKFTIKLIDPDTDNDKTIAETYADFSGISFSRKYYKKNNSNCLINKNRINHVNHDSPYDEGKYIERTISHEFGHVMEFLYVKEYWHFGGRIGNFFMNLILLLKPKESREIIKYSACYKAIKCLLQYTMIFDLTDDLGTYAQKNELEFFAEAFATLETSTDSKYQYIRDAVKNVISDWF